MLTMEEITTKINFSKIWRNTNAHFYMEKAHDMLLIRTNPISVIIRCQLFIRSMNGIEILPAFVFMMMNKTVILKILYKYSAELVNSKFLRRFFQGFWDLWISDDKWKLDWKSEMKIRWFDEYWFEKTFAFDFEDFVSVT